MSGQTRDLTDTAVPAQTFDPDAPCLVLAPHLSYPARNGSDISLDRMARCFSAYVPHVDLVAENVVVTFRDARETGRTPYANAMRGKRAAGLLTLIRNSHFYLEKFVTPAFRRRARELVQDTRYGTVLYSYITTTRSTRSLESERLPATRLIWSHNDEFKWFRDLAQATPGFLGRSVAERSERWLHRFFREQSQHYLLLHVTEADRTGYAELYPDHAGLIIPIGVDMPRVYASPLPPGTRPVRLTFIGSLGVRMNLDALNHFAQHFFPAIRQALGDSFEVHVAGSSPSEEVRLLCGAAGWTLHADLPDADLDQIIEKSTFTILPFNYATGAKLKLLKSMAHGVPFLATEKVSAQEAACIHPCLMSDDPASWADRILAVIEDGIGAEARRELQDVARRHSWEASAMRLFDILMTETPEAG